MLGAEDAAWMKEQDGAFTVAALTGYSRVQKGAHDPWQVVAGAVLGFFVAQEVAQDHHWDW